MGMETLNSAARAAGFAMAASDEPYEQVNTQSQIETGNWRPNEARLLIPENAGAPRTVEWFRTMLSLFGRRAPASPA